MKKRNTKLIKLGKKPVYLKVHSVLILINNEFVSVYVHTHRHFFISTYSLKFSSLRGSRITINLVVINIPSFYMNLLNTQRTRVFREAVDTSLRYKMDKKN